MYLNRLIREDRDRQIVMVGQGKDYSEVENEISDIEIKAVMHFVSTSGSCVAVTDANNVIDIPGSSHSGCERPVRSD